MAMNAGAADHVERATIGVGSERADRRWPDCATAAGRVHEAVVRSETLALEIAYDAVASGRRRR